MCPKERKPTADKMSDARTVFTEMHTTYLKEREKLVERQTALSKKLEEAKEEVAKSSWKWKKVVGDPAPIRKVKGEMAEAAAALEAFDFDPTNMCLRRWRNTGYGIERRRRWRSGARADQRLHSFSGTGRRSWHSSLQRQRCCPLSEHTDKKKGQIQRSAPKRNKKGNAFRKHPRCPSGRAQYQWAPPAAPCISFWPPKDSQR